MKIPLHRLLAVAVIVDAAALVCSGLLRNAKHGAAAIAGDVTWFVFLVGLFAVIALALATIGIAARRRRRHASH
jgi:hypothetical protein